MGLPLYLHVVGQPPPLACLFSSAVTWAGYPRSFWAPKTPDPNESRRERSSGKRWCAATKVRAGISLQERGWLRKMAPKLKRPESSARLSVPPSSPPHAVCSSAPEAADSAGEERREARCWG